MQVLNKYHDEIPEGAIWIMRPGFWGNPFSIGKDGDRDQVIAKYRQWLGRMIQSNHKDAFLKALQKLSQAPALVCCCKPKACHGDVLVEKMHQLGMIPNTPDENDI